MLSFWASGLRHFHKGASKWYAINFHDKVCMFTNIMVECDKILEVKVHISDFRNFPSACAVYTQKEILSVRSVCVS